VNFSNSQGQRYSSGRGQVIPDECAHIAEAKLDFNDALAQPNRPAFNLIIFASKEDQYQLNQLS